MADAVPSAAVLRALPDAARRPGHLPRLVPTARTFELASRPGAPLTVYLDVTGHTVRDGLWVDSYGGGAAVEAPAYEEPGGRSPGVVSAREAAWIQQVWAGVADDFAAWDVNVTTIEPPESDLVRADDHDPRYGVRVVVTRAEPWTPRCDCSGLAWRGLFDDVGEVNRRNGIVWVFTGVLRSVPSWVAATASHEIGHAFGLRHHGVRTPGGAAQEYYTGRAPWAPIMGAPHLNPVVQWSRGDYAGADNDQDDLAVIGAHASPVRDDYPDDPGLLGIVPLRGFGSTVRGVIGPGDVDVFSVLVVRPGRYRIAVRPAVRPSALDVAVDVQSALGRRLAWVAPWTRRQDSVTSLGTDAKRTLRLGVGRHFIGITGAGQGDPQAGGYSSYGAIGAWEATVTRVR
ncbi:zinc-dependent metalloprotease family protein [Nocardioides sp. R-C-SC26]|uniref:zinc-dependent metalloprotease family protein n=1 Tax=Nocardioides sp. R-C-SC26 TaxID=2870414 RepID=UPI001E42DF5F|nr:hypothetical protein [Nocardioides sp. R-C-SC26]